MTMKGNDATKGSRGEPILEIGGSDDSVRPKIRWDMHLNE